MRAIKNLVFEGGGAKGVAYAGAIAELQDRKLLGNIEQVAGSSAGSGAAAMLALGYSAEEVYRKVMSERACDILDIPCAGTFEWPSKRKIGYGLFSGKHLERWLKSIVAEKADENITFKQLAKKFSNNPNLTVIACNPRTKQAQKFNKDETPDVPVWLGLRMSCSVPFLLEPVTWQNEDWIDGGVVLNFPLTIYDAPGKPNWETLGFLVGDPAPANTPAPRIKTPIRYYLNCLAALLSAQDVALLENPNNLCRTVVIKTGEVDWYDFDLSKPEKEELIGKGREASKDYLDKLQRKDPCQPACPQAQTGLGARHAFGSPASESARKSKSMQIKRKAKKRKR